MSSVEVSTDGRIEVITGCMFSGKTEELMRRLRRARIAGQSVEVLTPSVDDRYGEKAIGSHNGNTWTAEVVDSSDLGDLDLEADVVAADEANFFDERLVGFCEDMASRDVRVVVSGIDQTFRGEPFEPVPELMAMAEYVQKLRAICARCGEPATRNQRLIDGEPAPRDSPTVMVGGEDSYEPRCRSCHELG